MLVVFEPEEAGRFIAWAEDAAVEVVRPVRLVDTDPDTMRLWQATKAHVAQGKPQPRYRTCKRGLHDLRDPDNVLFKPDGGQHCRECQRDRDTLPPLPRKQPKAPPGKCAKGLHDLDDPEVGYTKPGETARECRVCKREKDRARRRAKNPPRERRPPPRLTVCVKGLHDLTDPANVYTNPKGERSCRVCKAATAKAWRERKKEEAA